MINRIENSSPTSYKPSFGTNVTITNKLKPLLQHHKDIAPVLKALEESAAPVRSNGMINNMQVTLKRGMKWFKNYIQAECKITRADGQEIERKVDLLRYKSKTTEVSPTKRLENMGGADNAIKHVYNITVPNLRACTIINHKLPPKLYTVHEDTHQYFNAINEALDEIALNPTEGRFNLAYKLVKDKKNKSTNMELHYNLESAVLDEKGKKITSGRYQPLFSFNKDMSTNKTENGSVIFDEEISNPEELKAALIKDFNNLKSSVNNQIQNLEKLKKSEK